MGGRCAGLAQVGIRVGDVVVVAQALGDLLHIRIRIVGSQSNCPLFQLPVLLCPDIGGAVLVIAQERAADPHPGGIVVGVPLDIQMLTQQQTVGGIQGNIERILAGTGHLIGRGAHVPVGVAALGGIFVVYQGYLARPGAIAPGTGGHLHPVALPEAAPLQFSQHALDPVGAGLLDDDIGRGLAAVIGGAALVDLLHPAVNGGGHGGVVQQLLRLLHLVLLGFQLQLRLLHIHLGGLNLHSVLKPGGAGDALPLPLQSSDFLLAAFNGALQLGSLQIFLVQAQLKLLGVVAEKSLTLLYVVTLLDHQLLDGLFRIPGDLGGVLGHHQPQEPVSRGNAPGRGQPLHRLNINRILLCAAACQSQAQDKCQNYFPFHKSFLRNR